jgi:PAS domain-containing protein
MLITAYFTSAQGLLSNAALRFGVPVSLVLLSVILLRVSISSPKIQNGESRSALDRCRSMLDNLPVGVYRSTSGGKILEVCEH